MEHNGYFSFRFEARRQTIVVSIYKDGTYRGYLSYSPSDFDNTVDILHVHILSEHQKKGIGTELFDYLKMTRWPGMYIRINNAASAATTFYERLGIKKRTTAGPQNGESWLFPGHCHDFPYMKASGSRKRPVVRK